MDHNHDLVHIEDLGADDQVPVTDQIAAAQADAVAAHASAQAAAAAFVAVPHQGPPPVSAAALPTGALPSGAVTSVLQNPYMGDVGATSFYAPNPYMGSAEIDDHVVADQNSHGSGLNGRKKSWGKLARVDSLNLEAGNISSDHAHPGSKGFSWKTTLSLAFQSMGVIYGDIGTSPLYVFSSTFTDGIDHKNDILGVLSLILYTLILVPLIKYVCIVLWANDNGDGGTFALYSLLCRSAKVGLVPNHQPEDREVSNYRLDIPSENLRRSQKIKQKLESNTAAKIMLFLVTILGTSMVIGDGVLTPCISVLSAVGGISSLKEDAVAGISIAILIVIFCVQRFGTDKVGFAFAPAVSLWFLFISLTGVYNLFKYEPGVLRAFNPKYIVDYFRRNGQKGWISLGGVVLCITGAEAMFADLGHFSVRAISFSAIVFPALSAAYVGQASYLMKHPDHVDKAFYDSVPDPIYWPTFVVAVAAAIIASQAMISGAFSIIAQSLSLGCFPRVKVVHTSAKYQGQVYIPEVNYILMIACVIVTWGFKTTEKIGHAYGIAVVAVMVITTCMVTLIMLMIWKMSIWWIALFFVAYMAIDLIYLSAVLYKFTQGGYLPLAFSLVLMIIMGIWHYVYKERYMFELNNKVSNEFVRELAKNPRIKRVPGIGLLYSELVQGIPPIFPHFIANIPSVHSVVVMVSIKSIPISRVALEERFLFRQVEPREFRAFRCIVRYGYNDKIEEPQVFEQQMVENLKKFIRHQNFILGEEEGYYVEQIHESADNNTMQEVSGLLVSDEKSRRIHIDLVEQTPARVSSGSIHPASNQSRNSMHSMAEGATTQRIEDELQIVQKASDQGVFYLIGEAEVVAKQDSSVLKKSLSTMHMVSSGRTPGKEGKCWKFQGPDN